jgi:hypothetical protein
VRDRLLAPVVQDLDGLGKRTLALDRDVEREFKRDPDVSRALSRPRGGGGVRLDVDQLSRLTGALRLTA